MSLEDQLKLALRDTTARDIAVTRDEYDQVQHEFYQALSTVLWGAKGLVDSLGPAWNMVMDPRFAACEALWVRRLKTPSDRGDIVEGVATIDDGGNIATPVSVSLEQYATLLGEGRHFIKALAENPPNTTAPLDPYQVKDWSFWAISEFVKRECPNYFTRDGQPNRIATILMKLLEHDLLGLIMDYAEVANIEQWVFVESGDIANHTGGSNEQPIVHAEVEYLDRALIYRAMLRAATVKVLSKIGGNRLAQELQGVELTDFEKDDILKAVMQFKHDELYKALPEVLQILNAAKQAPKPDREASFLALRKAEAKAHAAAIKAGEITPLDLMDGEGYDELASEKLQITELSQSAEDPVAFAILANISREVTSQLQAFPKFQDVIDCIQPYLDEPKLLNSGPGHYFEEIVEKLRLLQDQAYNSPSIILNKDVVITETVEEN